MSAAIGATPEAVDVVVIGTGAGGAPLLAELARAGVRVVALEAGRAWDPRDFVADELAADPIYWLSERLSGGATPEAFGGNNSGIGVGGSTLHWGAFTPRADARDLRMAAEGGEDWPFGLDELTPLYETVEAVIGVSGPREYPWDADRRYRLPPVALNAPAQVMQRGCDALGIRHATSPAAVLTADRVEPDGFTRQACISCGHCHQGCRNDAKASTANTWLRIATAHGAEIRDGCMVIDLVRDSSGRISDVVYLRDGVRYRQACGQVFVCAGAVETPRLLLHTGLANSSGQVGRNYMAHVATQVWGIFDDEMRMNKGYPSALITEDFVRPDDADFAGGYLIQSLGVLPVTWANMLSRGGVRGAALVDLLSRYNHAAGIGINGETLPHDDNVLVLSDETDESGMARPLIRFSYHDNERALDAHATKVMRAIWQQAGASDIQVLPRVAHTIGTCRMGRSGDRNVVDPAGRSFDIDNLWICDNSVFPSALAANPALTIMALSLRTARAFLAAR
ncbi:choline dehydrogenase-like flavoprotein [Endobacter medicaginis]|uniref:Choline dehydrogenase-like flavoprotein n=2 Tax=Endobacter medicaginis TaxID=1181271 RepID=A0A839UZR9_9PROT|nr:choline dehydrogenase-like flavoprotein [Endobacter medicaginis]MCX5477044.1 GMC family oxidoreductase [Endobacter medicaginis]